MTTPADGPLVGVDLTLAYEGHVVASDLSVTIPEGSFTVIVGPNGCGKSTLLKALARTLEVSAGAVYLEGRPITGMGGKEVARRLALLPQASIAPEGITVQDLVSRGRFPHQSLLKQWSPEDGVAVARAMDATGVRSLAKRRVSALSGGQRQRVWLAMVLAQDTPLLLLDEPTTYLDITHQLDVLDLCADLHREGRTLVAVLHDLNLAARYASHMIAMRGGRIISSGSPAEVLTVEGVEEIFALQAEVVPDPQTGTPLVVPLARDSRVGVPEDISEGAGGALR
ncbi:MAG: ABC transporter ATP-binding protein [Acidimicrobiia bacterium]